jgi:sarcosine oxidase subunit beta
MSLPGTADVVVVGAGIQGVATAWNLARRGVRNIVVLDKGSICSGATGRCGAGIRAQWGLESNCRLALASLEKFETMSEDLGMDIGLKQGGYLMVAYQDREWEQLQANVRLQNRLGVQSRVVDHHQAREICPGLHAEEALGFTFHQRDGHADPFLTTFAYHRAARGLGVQFVTHCTVTGIRTESGQVCAVVTDQGTIHTPIVVNAAGGWAQFIAEMVDVKLPIWSERHEILITEPVEAGVCPPMLMSFSGNYYIQQRPHGSIIAGCSPEGHPQDFQQQATGAFLRQMSRTLVGLLPRTRGIRVVRQWSGLYNMSPDRQVILGEADEVRGFYLTCGFSGHGFMIAPVTSELLAMLIVGEEPYLPVSPLHYRRFALGELIREPAVV